MDRPAPRAPTQAPPSRRELTVASNGHLRRIRCDLATAAFLACIVAAACSGDKGPTGTTPTTPSTPNTPTVPTAASISVVAGTYQVVRTASAVWSLPSVLVKDASSSPISGATVTFAVTAGGGVIGTPAVTTNSSGIATLSSWTTGQAAAANTVSATVTGLAPVTFTAVATESADGKSDLLAGAVTYGGAFPAVAKVSYTDAGATATASAFPGQVTLFAATGTTESAANTLIRNAGGLILAQAPQVGYYLIGTPVGGESAFITALAADTRTKLVLPHLASTYGTRMPGVGRDLTMVAIARPTITVIDDCSGSHGTSVVGTVAAAGGGTATCLSDAGGSSGTAALGLTILNLLEVGGKGSGTDRLVNLSTYGGVSINGNRSYPYDQMLPEEQELARRQWLSTFKEFLQAIASIPTAMRQNLVVGICAGNNNTPIGPLMAGIRADPQLGPILAKHVLVVGATDSADTAINDAPGEPNFVKMTNATAGTGGGKGCSFATPRAMAALQEVIATTGVNAADALLAVKEAAAANADSGRLVTAEAVAKGYDIAAARGTDPPGAASVTAITFTAWGGYNRVVITPAIAGVTISYSVSGTDGYFDSGRIKTDATGAVVFNVPAGAKGVVDNIAATAVISGVSSSKRNTW
ncbi:MAG: hypothetical protein WC700_08570 [Gemmatimonadaceae bacterium]|jgi:hypothetical protein